MSAEERLLLCPVRRKMIPVLGGTKPGELIECPNCAGMMLRLFVEEGEEILRPVQLISCPGCGERIPIDEDTPAGTILRHDEKDFLLTKEFGAFALEAV